MLLAVVKNNKLYIDSGIEKFNDSGDVYLGISGFPRSIYFCNRLT
jgi:hypothetical protein